jgi:hypothetical protein
MSVSCEFRVLSGRGLCVGSPTERDVSECDREASTVRMPWPTGGCCAMKEKRRSNSDENNIYY